MLLDCILSSAYITPQIPLVLQKLISQISSMRCREVIRGALNPSSGSNPGPY